MNINSPRTVRMKNILHLSPEYVVFDSWFASGDIITACRDFGWHCYTQIKKNRPINGTQVRALHRHPYWMEHGALSCSIEVVVIKHGGNYLLTTDLSASRADIRARYKTRWVIQTLFRILHSQLGLGKCESRSLRAQSAHAHLRLMAAALLEFSKESNTVYALRRRCIFDPSFAERLVSRLCLEGA